jgi:hypothetical protein
MPLVHPTADRWQRDTVLTQIPRLSDEEKLATFESLQNVKLRFGLSTHTIHLRFFDSDSRKNNALVILTWRHSRQTKNGPDFDPPSAENWFFSQNTKTVRAPLGESRPGAPGLRPSRMRDGKEIC